MPDNTRFFLGYGERLTARIPTPSGGRPTEPSYTFEEAVARLAPRVADLSRDLNELPPGATPNNQAVAVVTLHPQWIAKSYHPQQLLNSYDLRQIGSRPSTVQPERWTRKIDPEPVPTTNLYLAGDRRAFANWASDMDMAPESVNVQIHRLEDIRSPDSGERVRGLDQVSDSDRGDDLLFEVVLHASEDPEANFILRGFEQYAESLGVSVDMSRRLHAGGLCFVPVRAELENIPALTEFAFLRVLRPMPHLRVGNPIERSMPAPELAPSKLPTEGPVDPDLRIAVFDGGFDSANSSLSPWVTPHETANLSASVPGLLDHGHDVTSAVLFGPLTPGDPAGRPYGRVDHYRVLDDQTEHDPYDLYDSLGRVRDILKSRQPQFFNLSIGPVMPIEDDEVHPWTALIDEHLSGGEALATIAVGNHGEKIYPESRIQVPSDAVNALAVGAADSRHSDWKRAAYSSVGAGRSPGRIKPDLVDFGGVSVEPFLVYDKNAAPNVAATAGTSFAAPAALRMAAGVRAHFGDRVGPLALKALLVHTADRSEHPKEEVGHGRVQNSLGEIVLCGDGVVRVLYQGELSPAQYLRAPIPMPPIELQGFVTVRATFCYASQTDPQDPGSYTRSGLDVTFRPHSGRFERADSADPTPKSFFTRGKYDREHELRNDAQKWETCMRAEKRFRGTSLSQPMFDIHYNAREEGGASRDRTRMRYALVVEVESPKTPDLYDQVVRAYAGQLEALQPIVGIPVKV